ncbi:O-antigen ligase family protein, partial [Listeria monocytogenes]|uniref:O-antigen ligase family protein n=1 Tax=Listeria monocytogenes TaxID=1639 RepID=UPI002FDC195D
SFFFIIPEIRNRFLELVDFSSFTSNSQTSTGIRYTIWLNAVELIKDSPIFGYGIGDVSNVFNSNFLKNGLIEYNKMAYNAHNQFLQIALA